VRYVLPVALFVIAGGLAVWLLRDAPQMPTESAAAAKRSIERAAQFAEADRAEMLYQGKGVPRDVPEAVRLWERAALNDITQAWRRLGSVYSTGDGVPVNATRAVDAWRHVAETGDVDGQKKLAWAYWTGWGTPRDPSVAVSIWQQIAEDVEVKYWLGEALMAGEGVPRIG
jgi:TPR repeat protein